jgi:hypothetical protein
MTVKSCYFRDYGRRPRLARLTLGITETEAAAAHGVTLRTYRRWEDEALRRLCCVRR